MTTIPPTPAPILPAVVAAAAGPVVTIPQPPPQILRLPPGATIETVVVASARPPAATEDARALVTLRTPEGEVSVRSAVPLDDGARVALEVLRNANNQVTARVVTINDVPVKQALAQTVRDAPMPEIALPEKPAPTFAAPRAPVLQPGQAWTPMGPAPLASIQPLSAYVLKAPTAAAPQPAAASPTSINSFLPGSELGIRIVSVQTAPVPPATAAPTLKTPASTPLPAGPAPGQSPTAPSKVMAPTPVSPTPAIQVINRPSGPGGPSLVPQTPTKPVAVAPPAVALQTTEPQGLKLPTPQGLGPVSPTPPRTTEAAPVLTRLTGQVTGATPTGTSIVQTPSGEIQLNVRANLPVGSTLVLEVMTALPPRPEAPPPSTATPGPLSLPLTTPTGGWASLTEAMQILQRIDPQTAAQLTAAVPDGGPKTAVATLAFMQAMRSGDARQWPGDTTLRGLERAGPRGAQLAAQISGEVREMAARASDVQGEWRTTPMPWNLDGRIERINLITRREGSGDDDGADGRKKSGKGKGTRFLVNLDLSNLGEMQLDGMFVKSTRAFDLMIRTKDALPEEMRRDLAGLFANSNAALGLKGVLTFHVVKTFPDPGSAPPAPDRGGVWA